MAQEQGPTAGKELTMDQFGIGAVANGTGFGLDKGLKRARHGLWQFLDRKLSWLEDK
jgi:hypothetical protein